jgi:hypothetical protein
LPSAGVGAGAGAGGKVNIELLLQQIKCNVLFANDSSNATVEEECKSEIEILVQSTTDPIIDIAVAFANSNSNPNTRIIPHLRLAMIESEGETVKVAEPIIAKAEIAERLKNKKARNSVKGNSWQNVFPTHMRDYQDWWAKVQAA